MPGFCPFGDNGSNRFEVTEKKKAAEISAAREIGCPPQPDGRRLTARIHALAPVLTRTGLASAEEIGIDTLADRLRRDVAGKGGVGRGPDIVSAWTRLA